MNKKECHQPFEEHFKSQLSSENQMLFLDSVGAAEMFMIEGEVKGPTKFRGKFQEANTQNKNKREYPYEVLNANIDRLMETVKARGLVGELDHPTDSIIHFEKASHVITDLWWEGNILMGEGEILPTPHGMILEQLIKSGVRVGISSRGVGNGQVRSDDGVLVIGEGYKLITFDAVADPSTFSAYQKIVTDRQRRESIDHGSNIIIDEPKSNVKNEATGIYTHNEKAVVAFVGQLIRNYSERITKDNFSK